MPRYSNEKREYQVGDYWLSQQHRSKAWCRTWYDAKARQTKRASLNTTDYEEAKELLTQWFIANRNPQQEQPDEIMLADILARYWEQHAKHIRSAEQARLAIKYWLEFYGERVIADLKDYNIQHQFHQWLLAKGMKAVSAEKVVKIGKAGINRAWKHGEIEHPPYIHLLDKKLFTPQQPRGEPMSITEIAQLFEASDYEPLQIFILLTLATASRPEAIREMQIKQCLTQERIIHLNPKDRKQTNKYRPDVRMPNAIVPLLERITFEYEPDTYIIGYGIDPIGSIRRAWRSTRTRAGLHNGVNPYSLRHTMARWLRQSGVDAWEVSAQLGHKRRDMNMTEVYAPHDPSYLKASCDAIDIFFADLRVNCVGVDKILNC